MFDKVVQMNLLFDFYGQLLTEKQQEVLQFYYSYDWSLGEISEHLGVSRQAVYDNIKRAEKILLEYEAKLQLVRKFIYNQSRIKKILKIIEKLEENFLKSCEEKNFALEQLEKMKGIFNELLGK
jgi:predicted DNA-binding protein YlxM (UPF0122 family)